MTDIGKALASVLDETLTRLKADGSDADLCSKTLMSGSDLILDYGLESCGGMLFVRLLSVNTTATFPESDVTTNNCAYTLAYQCEIGLLRPAVMPEQAMKRIILPTDEQHFDQSMRQYADMEKMLGALQAIGTEYDEFIIGQYSPYGPEGGIIGGIWSFTIGEKD